VFQRNDKSYILFFILFWFAAMSCMFTGFEPNANGTYGVAGSRFTVRPTSQFVFFEITATGIRFINVLNGEVGMFIHCPNTGVLFHIFAAVGIRPTSQFAFFNVTAPGIRFINVLKREVRVDSRV
jgi:hypothetical protein